MAMLPRKRKRSNVLSHPSRHKLPSCLPIPQGNWRSTITVSLAGTSTVLICNSLLLMSSLVKIQEDIDLPGVRTLYTGSCSLSARYNTIAHFLINIASTIILSSSGYCMQCLSAPTRAEIDRAHSKGQYLDIGILSVRNLAAISLRRVVLWVIIALASLPLHLCYNSMLFTTTSAYDSITSVADTNIMANIKPITSMLNQTSGYERVGAMLNRFEIGDFKTVEHADCVTQYSQLFFTAHGDLILTVNGTTQYPPVVDNTEGYLDAFVNMVTCIDNETIMQDACITSITNTLNSSHWWIGQNVSSNWPAPLFVGRNITQCLVESLPEHCKLQLSTSLAVAVIAANSVKIIAMLVTTRLKADPIMNLGDAISSFLQKPEASRTSLHPSERNQSSKSEQTTFNSMEEQESLIRPEDLKIQTRLRWHDAVGAIRWRLCVFLYYLPIIPLLLLLTGVLNDASPGVGLQPGTFGKINASYFLGSTDGSLIGNILKANAGQAAFSAVYFLYNGVITIMFMAKEWGDFSLHAKGLRVSYNPKGRQRSSYFLSLPYRYAAPLILLTGIMHWALSEALFVVNVQAYAYNDDYSQRVRQPNLDVDTVGYSPGALLLVISVLLFMFVLQLILGAKPLVDGVPLVGTNSIMMSSVCRPLEDGAAFSPLKLVVDGAGETITACHFRTASGDTSWKPDFIGKLEFEEDSNKPLADEFRESIGTLGLEAASQC